MPGASLRSLKRARNDECSPEIPHAPAAQVASNAAANAADASDAGKSGRDVYALADGELMHSTSRASAGKRKWLRLLPCLERQCGFTYVSCDGSSSGWHACVVAVGEELHLRARWDDMQVKCTARTPIGLLPLALRVPAMLGPRRVLTRWALTRS